MKTYQWLGLVVLAAGLGLASVFWLSSGVQRAEQLQDLPWQVRQNATGQTEVFGMTLGQTTLRQAIEKMHDFPEVAIFESKEQTYTLEAYFTKQNIGILEAKLILELAADPALLKQWTTKAQSRDPQASGAWRYTLNEAQVKAANQLPVRYVIYLPTADYSAELIRARFGEPNQQHAFKEGVTAWEYADKGLLIMQDAALKDGFYYSNRADFGVLRARLLAHD